MKPDESIKEMFTWFTDITNNLKSLGKTTNNEEMVRKIHRCRPKNKGAPKVTAVEEAQASKREPWMAYLESFLPTKFILKKMKKRFQKKKGVAFKTTSADFYSSYDEESMTMIIHGLNKMFKSKRS